MPVFQVVSRTVQSDTPPKKRRRRLRQEWSTLIRSVIAVCSAGGLFALLTLFKGSNNNDTVFILLPVFVSMAIGQSRRYNFSILFNGTWLYLLLTFCLALIYYSFLTAAVLLIHQNPTITHIILVTTSFTQAIIFDPVHMYIQRGIERRFNQRDREAVKTIETFTTSLRAEIDLEQLCERFISVIQKIMEPYSVSLWLLPSSEARERGDPGEKMIVADEDPLLAYMLNHPEVLEIERLKLASPILEELKKQDAELLLPLANQGELRGLLILGPNPKGEGYTREVRSMLNGLAPQVAPALWVAQLVQARQEEVRERERIKQEMYTARAIQHAFLPKELPNLDGWLLVSHYQPAREVGGDFYDFLSFADGRLGIIIGDVTDKGVPAALVMATTHSMLRAVAQEQVTPGEVLARVNDLLAAEIPARMFVTCFYAILEPASGRLRYANAGQELPYRRHNGDVSELWATGMPLGMLPGIVYEEQEVTLVPGESLLLYSDGLVEAHNWKRDMFDYSRLARLIGAHPGGPALIDYLLEELLAFTGSEWEQEDDVTIVALERVLERVV